MKKLKNHAVALWPGLAMIILILDSKTAIAGAGQGIALCLQSVIPSLLPFIFLSGMITRTLLAVPLPILRPVGKLCGIPRGAEGLLAVGLVGGYPVGAQCIAQACEAGQLTPAQGQRMLGFCNNAGPAFLFGILGPMFSEQSTLWAIWAIQILSAIFTGMLLPKAETGGTSVQNTKPLSNTDPMQQSIKAMAAICGWIVLFRVVLAFLHRWTFGLLPVEASVLLSGIFELTNGCCLLVQIPSEANRFLLATILLSFGGICIWNQTRSVTAALGTGAYIPGKLLQGSISILLANFVIPIRYGKVLPIPYLIIPALIVTVLILRKNLFKVPVAFYDSRVYNDKKEKDRGNFYAVSKEYRA